MVSTHCPEGESLRVIMVTPCYRPAKGGTESVVEDLSTALNRNNVHTDIMAFNMDKKWNPKWRGKIERNNGITVFKIPGLSLLPNSPRINLGVNLVPGRFMNLLKQYDIVHFHEIDFSFPLFSFPVRKPKVLHLHGICTDYLKRYHLSRFMLKHVADLYISISRHMEKDLAQLGISKDRITYLPNGVNTKLFCPLEKKEDNLILFVGRICFGKGLHILLESLRHLEDPVHLVLIGPADWHLDSYQRILGRIREENQKGKHKVTYLGALDREDIIQWYQKASIVVLPSFREGFPVVVLEALSCETPVIATPTGGVPEVVQDGKNGILVPINNPLRLAEAMQYLLDNKDVRTKFGYEGRQLVTKHFSVEVNAINLVRIYKEVLSR
jgi:glycosyltransferase involved in cell wall biosynthesis